MCPALSDHVIFQLSDIAVLDFPVMQRLRTGWVILITCHFDSSEGIVQHTSWFVQIWICHAITTTMYFECLAIGIVGYQDRVTFKSIQKLYHQDEVDPFGSNYKWTFVSIWAGGFPFLLTKISTKYKGTTLGCLKLSHVKDWSTSHFAKSSLQSVHPNHSISGFTTT